MNRTIGLLLSFMVMIMIAITVITASGGFFSTFGDSGDNVENSGCNFQRSQGENYDDLSEECRPESKQGYQYGKAYQLAAGGDQSSGEETP